MVSDARTRGPDPLRGDRSFASVRTPDRPISAEVALFASLNVYLEMRGVHIPEMEVNVNRCAAGGCGRWTRAGEAYCRRHSAGDEADAEDVSLERSSREGLAAFRARLAAGDYDALLGPGLRGTLRGAAQDPGLEAEVGALRLALVRLLDEERDPSRLAAGVARVAGVSVQAARLRKNADADTQELRALLLREAAKLEAELDAERATAKARKGVRRHDTNGRSRDGSVSDPGPGAPGQDQPGASLGLRGGDAADGGERG